MSDMKIGQIADTVLGTDVKARLGANTELRGEFAVGGKGGLDWESAKAMKEVGCVYLSFLGGGSALHSAAIKAVRQVAWDDLVAHYRLVKLKVEELGPLVVGIDSHGNSSFEQLGQQARDRMPEILKGLDEARAKASG